MMETSVDTLEDTDVMEAQPSIDEVLARWKARVDSYQYDPSKPQHYITLEEYGKELLTAVRAKI